MSFTLTDQSVDVGDTYETLGTRYVATRVEIKGDTLTVRKARPGGWVTLETFTAAVHDPTRTTLYQQAYRAVSDDGDVVVVLRSTARRCCGA